MKLKSNTALVTGGAVRIGRAICVALADRGCNVVVHYNRSAADAKRLCLDLEKRGVRAFAVKGNLASAAGCERILRAARRKAGAVNILVNNAAVFHKDTLESMTEAKLRSELCINLFAPVTLTKAFACQFADDGRRTTDDGRKTGGMIRGKVINLLDRRIAGNDPTCVPYVLSKKMLAEFTRNAALELAPCITVNGVAPGAILPPPGKGPRRVQELAGQSPLRRQCTPEEVAAAVVFLLESDAITGQTIFVDGGQHLLG